MIRILVWQAGMNVEEYVYKLIDKLVSIIYAKAVFFNNSYWFSEISEFSYLPEIWQI